MSKKPVSNSKLIGWLSSTSFTGAVPWDYIKSNPYTPSYISIPEDLYHTLLNSIGAIQERKVRWNQETQQFEAKPSNRLLER